MDRQQPGRGALRRAIRPFSISAIALSALSFLPAAFPADASPTLPAAPTASLSASQLSTLQSEVTNALAGINPSLSGVARIQAIDTALADLTQKESCALGAGAIAAIDADAITAGVLPTTAVDAAIRGGVACGIKGSTVIADAVIGAVGAGASAANVAAQALATASQVPMPGDDAGAGLGIAAAYFAGTNNLAAANQVGQTVANEGTQPTRLAYRDGVIQNGGAVNIAELGDAFPVATGETGQTGLGNNNNFGNNTNQGNGTGDNGTSNNLQANLNQNLQPCPDPTCT